MGGQPFALAMERQMVAVPETVKAKSREMYGKIPVQYVGIFTNGSLPKYNVEEYPGNLDLIFCNRLRFIRFKCLLFISIC